MNWKSISFDWNQVRAFLATVEEGSFSSAARALDSTQPTVGRQVTGLEEALGVTLFERTVRGPLLTAAGNELLDHVRDMGQAATLISLVASGQAQDVSGQVLVTSSDLMAATVLPPIVVEIHASSPGIQVGLVASNQMLDLARREADIAIRHVRPSQPELFARHIGDFRANYYAARAYLDRRGRPRSVQDLAEHAFVGTSDVGRMVEVYRSHGIPARPENVVSFSDSGAAMWELARVGMGVCLLPEGLCEADETMEKVLPNAPSQEYPVWLVTHRELRTNRRIRVVYDALARGLSVYA